MCRKFHGAEYATIASVPRESFRWLTGEENIREYRAANGTVRSFCSNCGSSLLFSSPKADANVIEVAIAAFDDAIPVTPDAHIFRASAANWSEVSDDLPEYVAGRDSEMIWYPQTENDSIT